MFRPLEIAMVVRSFSTNGGLELYTHKLVEGLLQAGHRVTVVCQQSDSSLKHNSLQMLFLQNCDAGTKAQRLKLQLQSSDAVLQSAGKFDIIHSQHFPVRQANVATFHNQTVYQMDRVGLPVERAINQFKRRFIEAYRLRDRFDALLCKNCSCLVFPSRVMRDDFYQTYSLEGKPSVVAYPGASLAEDVQPDLAPVDKPPPFTFLFVGKGFRKKGLDILLQSCAELRRRKKTFRVLIAGLKMKPLDRLRLELMGLSGTVQYLGFQKDMAGVYRQAHAFVLPSRMEPFGMAPLQAMRWGVPAIVSRVSGVSEVIRPGQDGLILEKHTDPGELSGLMSKMMEDDNLLTRLGQNAQTVARDTTWQQTVESTLQAYRIVLNQDTAARQVGQDGKEVLIGGGANNEPG